MFLLIIIIALVLAGFMAPIIMVANKKKLQEMDKKITEFEGRSFVSQEEREKAKQLLKRELIKIKAGIQVDKKSTEIANDKISIL